MLGFFPVTRLCRAATNGDLVTIKSLATESNCNSAGFMAASAGHSEIVAHLLSLNATPDVRDSEGHTPLHLACGVTALQSHLEIINLLLEKGALINAIDDGGYTALHLAVTHQQKEVAKLLIEKGCSVDMQLFNSNFTPFHTACELKDKELIALLLESGADPSLKDSKGRTGIEIAKENGLLLKIDLQDTTDSNTENLNEQI